VSSIAVDTRGDIFWGTRGELETHDFPRAARGKQGDIYTANVDAPNTKSVKKEVSISDKVVALHLIKKWLLFASADGDVYAKAALSS